MRHSSVWLTWNTNDFDLAWFSAFVKKMLILRNVEFVVVGYKTLQGFLRFLKALSFNYINFDSCYRVGVGLSIRRVALLPYSNVCKYVWSIPLTLFGFKLKRWKMHLKPCFILTTYYAKDIARMPIHTIHYFHPSFTTSL